MRIFIGFSEVAGFYSILSQGFAASGHTVKFRSFGPNPFNYSIESRPSLIQRLLWISTRLYHKSPNVVLKLPSYVMQVFLRVTTIFPLMLCSDLIILNYSGTLFCYLDILVLRLLGKRIIYIFHGSDARPPYFNGKYIYPNYSLARLRRLTYIASLRIRIIQALGCVCMVQPAISHFFTKPIVNLSMIGLPWPLPVGELDRQPIDNSLVKPFTILHAPSNSVNKGTAMIREAIQQLSAANKNINYVEIFDQPNSAVLKAIASADLIIDELWSDARLAGLGCEAASCNVPTLIGSYYTDKDWQDDTDNSNPLVITANPDNLAERIAILISNTQELDKLKNDLAIAQHQYLPQAYSSSILNIFLSSPLDPEYKRFWYDPLKCSYLYGWGAPSNIVINVLIEYVIKFGLNSLCIPSNSRSFHLIKDLASSRSRPVNL